MMHGPADEQVQVEFAPECAELGASAAVQNRLGHAKRAAKSGDHSADGGNLYLSSRIPDKINLPLPHSARDRHPALVNGNARTLECQWGELPLLQEPFEISPGFLAFYPDQAQNTAVGRLRNEPIEIRCIVGNKPHADGISRHSTRQPHQSLNEWRGNLAAPATRLGHPASRTIGSDNGRG